MRSTIILLSLFALNTYSQKAFKEGKWYGFEENGDVIIQPDYEYATDFVGGFACVKKYGKWGFIDSKGKWLIEPLYDKVAPFLNGYAKVAKSGKVGLVDISGKLVLKPIYDEINYTYDGTYIELVRSGKKGLYSLGFSEIPCMYQSVGMNDNGIAYGEIESNKYDIYDAKGIVLQSQEHPFSGWNVKESIAIAMDDDQYGLFNIASKQWVIDPKFVHIQSLYTEKYKEINALGDLTDYTFIYALFTEVGEVNYSMREKTNGSNKFSLVKAGSLNVFEENLIGYEQIKEGYGYNKTYDYILTFSDQSKKMMSTVLGIAQGLKWEDEEEFRGAKIKKESGMTSLYYGDELHIKAESIFPLTYKEEYQDKAGNTSVKESILDIPYLVIRQNDRVSLFDVDRNRFVLDNLPSNTEFKLEKGSEYNSYKVTYSADGIMGMFTNKLKPTEMIYQDVVDIDYTPYMLVKKNEEYQLLEKKDREKVLVSGSAIELFFLTNGYVFLVEKNGRKSFYNPRTKNLLGSYDEIEVRSEFRDVVVTRVGDLYGLHDVHEEVILEPQVNDKSAFFKNDVYPYYFFRNGENYVGIDGYSVKHIEYNDVEYDEKGNARIGFYEKENDGVFKPINNAVFKDGYAEIYPFFHMKGQNNKYGIVNHMGDTLVPFEYNDFGYADVDSDWGYYYNDEILMSYSKEGVGLLSVREGQLVPNEYKYIEVVYDLSEKAAWLFKKKRTGLYVHGNGVVYPAIYKSIYPAYEFLEWETDTLMLETPKGKLGLGSLKGDVFLPAIYDEIQNFYFEYSYPYRWNHVLEVKLGKKVGIYIPQKNQMLVEPIYDDILEMDRVIAFDYDAEGELYAYIVLQGGKKGVVDYHGNKLLPALFDDLKVYPYNSYYTNKPVVVWGETEGKMYVNINDPIDPTKAVEYDESVYYDKVFGYSAYRFSADEITVKNFLTGEEKVTKDEAVISGEVFDLLYRNGKYGAVDKEGNVLVEPIYDSGDFMPGREHEVMIGFENGVKYYVYVFSNSRYTEEEW